MVVLKVVLSAPPDGVGGCPRTWFLDQAREGRSRQPHAEWAFDGFAFNGFPALAENDLPGVSEGP
jgi:hypothetical protein